MNEIAALLRDFGQGASNAAASNVSGPVDLLAWALRKGGVPVPSNPILGSEWMRQKGLLADPRNKIAGLLGEAAGLSAPIAAAAKAPQIARGLLGADDALTAGVNRMADHFERTGATYRFDPKQRGAFMGANSKTWDAASNAKAAQMESAGADPRVIWKETGNWKGPDGKWRQEIDDSGALFNARIVDGKKVQTDILRGDNATDYGPMVGGLLEHQPLQDAYGGVTKSSYIGNKNTMFGDGVQGAYDAPGNSITINAPAKATDAKSTALHEIQHAIQQREGFAAGGSSDMAFRDPRMWGKDGAAGSDIARQMLKAKMREMATPQSIEQYAKNAWGSDVVTPEIQAAYKDYAKSLKSSVGQFANEAQKTVAQEWYRRLAGEAEARATQARMNLDAAQRRGLFPADSYDVPIDQLIVRYGDAPSNALVRALKGQR